MKNLRSDRADGANPGTFLSALGIAIAFLVLLPGRTAAKYAGLPKGSDHEQILSMFANTAFWTLVGVVVVILVI